MIAEAHGIGYLKRDRIYQIPFFQREYVWDEENWEEFYDSIIDSLNKGKTAFLGSIIIKDTNRKKWDKSIYNIIDGQQRFTTISLFIKAFMDEKITESDRFFQDYMSTLFIYESYASDNKQLKINHSRIDKTEYENCITSKYLNYEEINNESRIVRCYKYFRNRFKDENDIKIINLLKELILNTDNEKYKIFVAIEIDSTENEQKIFDTVNSSGVKLTSADIIKNAIFEKMISLSNDSVKVVKFYGETWEKTFINNQENLDYWTEETVSGRIKRERIEVLLHSVAVIFGIYDPHSHKIDELPSQYKEAIEKMDEAKIEQLVRDICDFAELYKEKFIDYKRQPGYQFSMDNRLELFHKIIDVLKISTFDPYILHLYHVNKTGDLSDENLNKQLLMLEKYIVRTIISNSPNKKNFNKNNSDLINKQKTIDELIEREDINNAAFKNGINNLKTNLNARLLLFVIELERIRNSDGNSSLRELAFIYTLEHIIPISYQAHWNYSSVPVYDDEGILIENDPEREKEIREASRYRLGNMTLLTQKLNSKVGHNSFNIKLNGLEDGKKTLKGIKEFAQLSISLDFINLTRWDERDIKARTDKLFSELLKIW